MKVLEHKQYTQFGVDHLQEIIRAAQTGCETAEIVLQALEVMDDADEVPLEQDLRYAVALHGYIAAHYPRMLE